MKLGIIITQTDPETVFNGLRSVGAGFNPPFLPAMKSPATGTGAFHLAENRSLSRDFVPLGAYLRLKAEFLLGIRPTASQMKCPWPREWRG